MRKGTLIIIAAPSGAGKTSLVSELIKNCSDLVVSISHTTRPKRFVEQNQRNYYFVAEDEFETLIAEDAFLEYAKVFGNYYGTSRCFVEQHLRQGNDVILEIDWQGAEQIRRKIPANFSIFILPPSLQALRERLEGRKQDESEIIERRLQEAKIEMQHYAEFDYLVVNDHFEFALQELISIITAERLRTPRRKQDLQAQLQALGLAV